MAEIIKTDIYPSMVVSDEKNTVKAIEQITIGKQLKEIRTNSKLTLEEDSKLTGLARSTLSKIENEQRNDMISYIVA